MKFSGWAAALVAVGLVTAGLVVSQNRKPARQVGKQADGGFVVSTGQYIVAGTIPYPQRLSDLALHPSGRFAAVLAKNRVFLADSTGVIPGTDVALGADAGFHGIAWVPGSRRFIVSTAAGHLQEFTMEGDKPVKGAKIELVGGAQKGNPVPGGMCVNQAGTRLYVACADWNGAVEVDLSTNKRTRFLKAEEVPFGCALTPDEKTLLVSNWGGETPAEGDTTMASGKTRLKITEQGYTATGTVTAIDLANGSEREIATGLHPTEILCHEGRAYVACAMTDSVDVIDLKTWRRTASWRIKTGKLNLIGSMPNALALRGDRLLVANGGDNAIGEIDIKTGRVAGFRPAGFFPTSLDLTPDGNTAFVLNTKGNGSVREAAKGSTRRNTHDFQGTVSILDLTTDLATETQRVASFNQWETGASQTKLKLKVYQGGIKHVIYVIKENRTYDEIYGDLPVGNGDPKLCSLGETVMPNHRKIAQEFTLFDNSYTSGTNSADGHQWAVQSMANEYLEHFYVGYSRTYPDDGTDALAMNSTDRIWDAAMRRGLSVRVYGEWADDDRPIYKPRAPKDWFEAWEDRKSGRNEFQFMPTTDIPALKKILAPGYHYWPLVQSDQHRMDVFEKEFRQFEANGKLPNLIVMTLPCDHGEGTNPAFPTPRAMMADNDLALGRLVDLVSHSRYWKDTAIVVTEDDSQSGPDHVDGHRTSTLIVSPYTRRSFVSSEFLTHVSLHKTMGSMLGFGPLCKFDAIATPATECFTDTPDLTPYRHVLNKTPLDEPNPGRTGKRSSEEELWYQRTMALDWSSMDRADPYWINRINWWSIYRGSRPYPGRPGERPGMVEDDD
jgi:DNA-binding beta-propeller fold protein YncE